MRKSLIIKRMVVYKLLLILSLTLMAEIQAQKSVIGDDYITNVMKSKLGNITHQIASQIQARANFCILDGTDDWNKAFNYTDWNFFTNCMEKIGDVENRLCTETEIQFYLHNLFNKVGVNYMKPNRNCNSTSWVSGCEPGWACSSGSNIRFEVGGLEQIPVRTLKCNTCCEGFFCPRGLTCMIPCPLGSYCPLATLNVSTGVCEPYRYKLQRGMNHSCGGADVWANIYKSEQIFCPEGSYCPTTTEKKACGSGYYCPSGSTSESRCSTFISCKGTNENQNTRAYGIIGLIVALVVVLLIVYSLSRQLLAIRERRGSKYNIRAAISVQHSALVRAKWSGANDVVLNQAAGLHANLLQRFSQKNFQIFDDEDVNADGSLLLDQYTNKLNDSESLPSRLEGEFEGLVEIEHLSTNESCSQDKLGLKLNEKELNRKMPKAEEINMENQIFMYPYDQTEDDKTKEPKYETLTLPGGPLKFHEIRTEKRPPLEIAFKDLTLTLKGKEKCLLKNLTGKIKPSRITAVMGPSGAGKTTFISALAGKETGCAKSGLVLINGKPESIHSYKKIVGFVPQDDIVHGNLTVEENLLFTACCRLSTLLSRADKVSIVERIINNLGLQEVRDFLVGTVEKRGISGGQRKRVNIGLEMVVEPSVLFLDEPTSGLDSSSSRQLLETLKHETLAGVNICMIVHQPSYALFKMFDDLILLAKGGLMVYNGSVSQVDDYFAGLGIIVPERVNPADYYIDVLEGLVGTSINCKTNYEMLSTKWMLYSGYSAPEDMQSRVIESEKSNKNPANDYAYENNCFSGKLWRKDLSNRRAPGVILQYKYFLGRITKQRLHEVKVQATDFLIVLIVGACLGALSMHGDVNFGSYRYSYTVLAISLSCQTAALRTFSLDKLQYTREHDSGMSILAHFLAKDTLDQFNTAIKPIIYLLTFYPLTNPRSTFLDHYIVLISVVYCVTGIGYAFAILLNPATAQLLTVIIPVCLTLVSSQALENTGLRALADFCYPKWAIEALVIANARRYHGVWLISRCSALSDFGYNVHHWNYYIMFLIILGILSRVVAFIGLLVSGRK